MGEMSALGCAGWWELWIRNQDTWNSLEAPLCSTPDGDRSWGVGKGWLRNVLAHLGSMGFFCFLGSQFSSIPNSGQGWEWPLPRGILLQLCCSRTEIPEGFGTG